MLWIFDVDGTLIRSFLREGAPPEDFDKVQVLDGRYGRLNDLKQRQDARFAIASNQAGVAMGYQTEAQVRAKLATVVADLGMWDVPVTVHVAFNHPEARLPAYKRDDGMRKPGPGMLLQALQAHRVGAQDAIFVGDMDSDRQAAVAARVPYVDQAEFF